MLPLPDVLLQDREPASADFRRELLAGLSRRPRSIPPKFFYDEAGSRLFARICATPEYYLTRTELAILRDNAGAIARRVGRDCLLIEPGSGNSAKVRALLGALRPRMYVPVDISREYLRQSAAALAREYPWLRVCAACADFTQGGPLLPQLPGDGRRVAFFPGSTIGNLEAAEAEAFLARLARIVGRGGGLLIGVDLRKDPAVLEAAYDDAGGVTAEFNLNLLARANRELGADFDPAGFAHRALYDAGRSRVEMHLLSLRNQQVNVGGRRFDFRTGESIHTENAYKYSIEDFSRLARAAGFGLREVWTDPRELFSVQYYSVGSDAP